MKRGLCALIIFCLCIVLSVYLSAKAKDALGFAEIRINEIRLLCEDGENKKALIKAREFREEWEKKHPVLKISFEQSTVRELETAVSQIPRLIENGKTDRAIEICEDTVNEIEYLLLSEKICFENIF